MKNKMLKYLIVFIAFYSNTIKSQTSDFSEILRIDATADFFTVDVLGNIYLINNDYLTKYNKSGKVLSNWSSKNKGRITSVDTSDPMKILVNCGDFGIITLLDNNLNPVSEQISLAEMGFIPPFIVCNASEGGFWLFDNLQLQLIKFSNNLKIIVKSPEIKINENIPPQPVFMLEYNNNVFISDTNYAVLITDKYGALIRTLPIKKVKEFHCYNNYLIYNDVKNINFLNLNTLNTSCLSVPYDNYKSIKTDRNKLYILDNKGISIFNLSF